MKANADDLANLLELQNIDFEILRHKKQFDGLPQRDLIIDMRKKKSAIIEKHDKIATLKRDAERRLTRILDEDASLQKKQQGVRAALDAAKGDYRNVEARNKELNGILKRRATLEGELEHVSAEIQKIEALEKQVNQALDNLVTKEEKTINSFQKEGGALKEVLANLEDKRDDLVAKLPPNLVTLYDRTAKRSGGVALAKLQENRCGACRATIESGHLIEIKNEAPLSTCPSCKRMLIIS